MYKIFNTEKILRENFDCNDAYINRFQLIAKNANITLDALFLGRVDSEFEYTSEERDEIVATLILLVAQQFSRVVTVEKPTYTSSAGAPGAGKTFALEKMFKIDVISEKFPENAVYVGPDSVVLPQMQAHMNDCKEVGNTKAYEKWRDASNYIANFMLVKAITDSVNIVHDTTATSTRVKTILDTLGQYGYIRHMHFYVADHDARKRAIMHRKENLGFTMVSLSDASSKAVAAYERLADHSYEERVEQLVLYAQEGAFWLGRGATIAFAIYNPTENLNKELQDSMHEAVKTWVNAPEPTIKLAASLSFVM